MSAIHVNDTNFETEVLSAEGAVLVDFHAPWCGPCRSVSPIVDELAREVGETVKVVKVNVDESQSTAARYGVTSIPAFFVLKNGEVQGQLTGAVPKADLSALIEPHLGA